MPIQIGQPKDYGSPTSFLSQYASLNRLARRRYDPADNFAFTSPYRVGTIERGPSATHLYDLTYDRDAYTVIEPPKSLTAPVFGGGRNRTGNFTLDLVDWNHNLSQMSGSAIGKDTQVGGTTWGPSGPSTPAIDPQLDYLAARDIDFMVNGPRRLMDYAFAPATVLASAVAGKGYRDWFANNGATPEYIKYPFQANAEYWGWLAQSTAEERKQQARIMADSRADRARNEPLYALLAAQFDADFNLSEARSSGNVRLDYLAKRAVQANPYIEYFLHPERHPSLTAGLEGKTDRLFDPEAWAQIKAYTDQTANPTGYLGYSDSLGQMLARGFPFVGTQMAQAIEAISPETEKKWLALTVEERTKLLEAVGFEAMAADFAVGWFGLTGIGRAAAFLGSAQRVEASAAALGARMNLQPLAVNALGRGLTMDAAFVGQATARATAGVTWGVSAVNKTMATGLAVMTASWAIQSYAPMETEWGEALGTYAKAIDLARPISNSSLAGVLNEAGFFAGFYGLDYLAPRILRSGGAALHGVPGFGGVRDLAFHQSYGGSELGRIFERNGITLEQQGAALSAEFTSGLVNSRRAALADVREAIESGSPTGLSWIDELPIERRGEAWEEVMAKADRHIIAGIDAQIQIMNGRMADPQVRKLARSMDDQVTAYMLRRYGSTSRYWGPQIADMKAATSRFVAGLGLRGSLVQDIEKWAGKSTDRWGQATRRTFQMLFHKRHGEMAASATKAGEDPGRFAMFSLRTLFADEIPDMVRVLTDADPAVSIAEMRRLIDAKDDVQMLHARGQFSTPEELADLLAQAQPVLPARRIPTPDGDELDAFQIALDGEGLWTIGYKPVGRFVGEVPEAWVRLDDIATSVPDSLRTMITVEQLEAMGYRRGFIGEIMPGPEFRKRNPIWPIHEYGGGVWVKRLPGDDVREANAAANTQPYRAGPQARSIIRTEPAVLTDDGVFGFEVPDSYDLKQAIEPGTQTLGFKTHVATAFHGRGSITVKPGEGALLPDEWTGYFGVANLDTPPSRSLEEMQDAWEYAHFWQSTPDRDVKRAGVIVYEQTGDGSVGFWLIKPKAVNGRPYHGYDLTWPKGGAENEPLVRAAARELREETGFDAEIRRWLGDVEGVRYYLAVRKSGGPDFMTATKEVEHLELVNPTAVASRLTRDRDRVMFETAIDVLGLQEMQGGVPQVLHGRNAGADWPVLTTNWGEKYLFKAQQTQGGPVAHMTQATRLAGPTSTKLFVHVGLKTAPEAPFTWQGIRGTIQPLIDVEQVLKLDPQNLAFYQSMHQAGGPDVIGELQRQHVADWFTSQHDSNSDAFLMTQMGEVAGIDKGQSWKYFETDHELAAYDSPRGFWTYGVKDPDFPNPANHGGDVHLGQYLWDFKNQGGFLDRNAVEDVVRKIESITDQEMHEWLDELAYARELQGRTPGGDDFVNAMIRRRDTLRDRVNAAYNEIGQISIARPGQVNHFKAGQSGTMSIDGSPELLNRPPIPGTINPDLRVPPLPDKPTFVGVIVEESDGRIWTTKFSDGSAEIPTSIDEISYGATEADQATMAMGVVENYFGLSVRVDEFIADIPSWDGSAVTRWFLARRTGGGPGYAYSSSRTIALGKPDQLRVDPTTGVVMNGSGALDALAEKRNPPLSPDQPVPVEPGRALPDDEARNEYVSYTVLPSGMVYRSPWIDYPIPHLDDVNMGNRAILSARLDAAFVGWRTTRILEIQKGTLYRRLDSISPSFTSARVQEFHDQLLEMAREHNFPGIQPLGLSRAWPDILPGVRKQNEAVFELAERIFGKGPYLSRDGRFVSVDWQREIATAYTTALKLNLTAGVTSHLKSLGVGQRMAVISDVFYQAFRFALSPLFKSGEWAEAPVLNAMRGTNPFGMDDVARSTWQRAGLPHAGADLGLEMMTDPMMANVGGQPRIEAARRGWLSAAPPEGYAAQVAEMRNPTVKTVGQDDQAPTGLMDNIFPRPQVREFPDLPTHSAELLIPHKQDPLTGEFVADPVRMRELDAARLAKAQQLAMTNMLRDVSDPVGAMQALEDLSIGMGWLDYVLPPAQSRRLAMAAPIVHSIGKFESMRRPDGRPGDMARIKEWIENGMDPLTSPSGHGAFNFKSVTTGSGEQVFTTGGLRPSTSEGEETLLAMTDAPYAGHGLWMDGVRFVLRNDRMLPRAVITDGDRMNFYSQGPIATLNEHIVSANGAVDMIETRIRTNVLRMAQNGGYRNTLVDQVQTEFSAMHPLEYAWPEGGTWEDIDAVVFTRPENLQIWNDLVATHGDSIPGLRDIEPILVDTAHDSAMSVLWRRAFEKAGIASKADQKFDPNMLDDATLRRILPDEAIVPHNVDEAYQQIRTQLDQYGGSTGTDRRWSLEDLLRAFIWNSGKRLYTADESVSKATGSTSYYGSPAAAKQAWERELESVKTTKRNTQNEIDEAQALLDEMLDWRARQSIEDYDVAQAIIDNPDSTPQDVLRAEGFQTDWQTFASRFRMLDQNYRPFDRARLSTGQFSEARLPESQFLPEERIKLPAGTDADTRSNGGFGGYRFSDEQEITLVRAMNRRLLTLQQHGLPLGKPGFMTQNTITSSLRNVVSGDFVNELKRLAELKTGQYQSYPQVRVWLRGEVDGITKAKGSGEVIITVSYPDGTNPLTLEEISDVWKRHATPTLQSTFDGGRQPVAQEVLNDFGHLWTPVGGPHGSLIFKSGPGMSISSQAGTMLRQGDMVQDGNGLWGFLPDAGVELDSTPRPIRFLYSFEDGGHPAFWNLDDDLRLIRSGIEHTTERSSVPGQVAYSPPSIHGKEFRYVPASSYQVKWAYGYTKHPDFTEVWVQSKMPGHSVELALRDAMAEFREGNPVSLNVWDDNDVRVIARLHSRGEFPPDWIIKKSGTQITDADLEALIPLRRADVEAPPDSLAGVPGSPEAMLEEVRQTFLDKIKAASGAEKERLQRGWAAFWNPVPYKQRQQDRLMRDLMTDWYPPILKRQNPKAYDLYAKTLGVPDDEIVDFILQDRLLWDRWIASNSADDFNALVAHADKYGIAKGDTRADLDSLYESPDWPVMMEIFRWTAKAAQEEAFGVHFFTMHRSTFERSINHPLLGVYPASWSYKVAKEWFRFLYLNETFGFRLGMQPAHAIATASQAQKAAFARSEGEDLDPWLEEGPLSSSLFIFNLLMPGDWSAIPFPLSRSLRDMLRGNFNPADHFRNNMFSMGLGRDVRLVEEAAKELITVGSGTVKPRMRQERLAEEMFRR